MFWMKQYIKLCYLSCIQEPSPVSQPQSSPSEEIGIGAKKKSKFVPLYSKEGEAKSVIQLPGE